MRRTTLLLILLISSPMLIFCTEDLQDIEAFTGYVIARSTEYQGKAITSNESRLATVEESIWENASISTDIDASYDLSDADISAELSTSIPLNDRLSLSASIDTSLDGSASLTYSPFAVSWEDEQAALGYQSALLDQQESESSLYTQAVSALIDYRAAERAYELALRDEKLQQQLYEDEKIRFDLGVSALEDLQDQLVIWNTSLKISSQRASQLMLAEHTLEQLLGDELEQFTLPIYDLDAYARLADELDPASLLESSDMMTSSEVLSASLLVQQAVLDYEQVQEYTPDLSVTAGASYSDFSLSGSISFSYSPQDILSEEKEIARQRMSLQQSIYAQTVSQLARSITLALQQYSVDLKALETAQLQLQQSDMLLQEAQLLLDSGSYSQTEYEETALQSAEAREELIGAYDELILDCLEIREILR